MKKRVLRIAHIHVWDKKNKGDVAIVLAVQELLKSEFSGVQILDFPVETLKVYSPSKIKRINQCDLVIFGGGGLFYHYFLPYEVVIIKAIKPPLFIFGVGYIKEIGAPDLSRDELAGLLALVNRASIVGVRDYYTRDYLLKNKVPATKIKVIGDPAVLLPERKLSGYSDSKTIKLGLNLNYSGWLGFGVWREDILRAYREVAEYFQNDLLNEVGRRKNKVQVYYLQHHPGEKNIYKELAIPGLRLVNLPPAEQKYVYGELDLVVGMMLHAGVMAFGALTPEINVAYDLRNYSFAKFIGAPELVVDLDKLKEGALLKRVKLVWKNHEKYVKKFSLKKQVIKKLQTHFLKQIHKSL